MSCIKVPGRCAHHDEILQVEHFFVSGAARQVNAERQQNRPFVTPVTKREFPTKKSLILPKMSLDLSYHLDPVQGPAGRPFREVLPLPKQAARLLVSGAKLVLGKISAG